MTYEKIKYPDGQISVKVSRDDEIRIPPLLNFRINNYEDLFLLKSIKEAWDYQYPEEGLDLFIPSLFGQRSDRRFSLNQSFDLKIICDFINSCGFKRVQIFDPHSDVSLALINNSEKVSSFDYVNGAIQDIGLTTELILISPDAGAYKKVFEYGKTMGLPVAGAIKHRDRDGKIDITFVGEVRDKDCLIIDDLGDGCRTFVELAKQLRAQGAQKVYLYISHAYFSAGLEELRKYIDHIYCTNSVKDLPDMWFDGNGTVPVKDFVTQFVVI